MLPGAAGRVVGVEHDVLHAQPTEVVRRGEAALAGPDHQRVVDHSVRDNAPTRSAGYARACLDDLEDRVGDQLRIRLLDRVAGVHDHLLGPRAEDQPATLFVHVGTHPARSLGNSAAAI